MTDTETQTFSEAPMADTPLWHWAEERVRRTVSRFGYQEIRLPILESAELYTAVDTGARTFGAADVVLRPDGTPGCIKAVIEGRGGGRQEAQRVWYQGPIFRQEPDGPRLFHQFGFEAFGMEGAELDAELILLARELFSALGLSRHVSLAINTLGSWREQADGAALGAESTRHFKRLCQILRTEEVAFGINPALAGGRGYYTRTVFEWTLLARGEPQVLASGGRYDELAGRCCGRSLAASGFGFDFEHLLQCIERERGIDVGNAPHIVIRAADAGLGIDGVLLCQRLRRQFPAFCVQNDLATGSELPASAEWLVTLCSADRAEVWSREHHLARRVAPEQIVDLLAGRIPFIF